jgi:hypothetical protein
MIPSAASARVIPARWRLLEGEAAPATGPAEA